MTSDPIYRRVIVCALACALTTSSAAAQETRADDIAAAQAAKAQDLVPYTPNKKEATVLWLRRTLFDTPNGFYPWLDSVYSGGGFTLGGGYRHFYGDRTFWDARGLYSVKAYKLLEVATESFGAGRRRVTMRAVGGWRDATQVSFYGVGGDTLQEAQSNFRMQQAYVGGFFEGQGPRAIVFNFGMSYEDYTLKSGQGSSASIEHAFTPQTAPGLGANPDYIHTVWSGGIDWRPSPGYARRGGLYALTYDNYFDMGHSYTFDRVQAEVVQHLPVLRENWVVSLHSVARTTVDDDDIVPYFLMPALGSGSTLRGYSSWRFRDRHSLLLSGEWRWIPSRLFLDMAFFYDAGKVAARREDLNFENLKHDAGVGIRLHGPMMTPLRIDFARGTEGLNIVFSGSAAF